MGLPEEYVALLKKHGLQPPQPLTPKEFWDELEKRMIRYPGKIDRRPDVGHWLDHFAAGYDPRTQFCELDLYTIQVGWVLAKQGIAWPTPVYFGEFPTREFNAVAQPTDSGVLCLVNTGLIRFLQEFPRACFSTAVSDASGVSSVSSLEDFTNALGEAIAVAYLYLIHSRHNASTDLPKSGIQGL